MNRSTVVNIFKEFMLRSAVHAWVIRKIKIKSDHAEVYCCGELVSSFDLKACVRFCTNLDVRDASCLMRYASISLCTPPN